MFFKRKEAAFDIPAPGSHQGFAGVATETVSAKSDSGSAAGKWYLQQALQFEKSKHEAQEKLTKIAITFAIGGGVLAGISIIGATALVQLKRPNPPAVLRVDEAHGTVDVLSAVADGREIFTQKNDRADLRRYVEMREGYDWETIQDMFDSVKIMTADQEQKQFIGMYGLPNAPQKILKDQYRVLAHVGAITFIGSTAQVFFSKKLISVSGGVKPKTDYWVATVAYRHDKLPERRSDLDLDPTGFRVTSYTVDRDWTHQPDDADASQKGAADNQAANAPLDLPVVPAAPPAPSARPRATVMSGLPLPSGATTRGAP